MTRRFGSEDDEARIVAERDDYRSIQSSSVISS